MGQTRSKHPKEIIIMSVGGSLIVPEEIDVDFLRKFRRLIISRLRRQRFILIAGGGRTCRKYQNAAREIVKLTKEDADWLGIHTTRLNAHLMRTIFKDYAYPKIIFDPNDKISFKQSILVAAGHMPGCSTDHDAVMLAKNLGVKKIINMSNIDYAYDKDPKKFRDARKIERTSWEGFRKIVGNRWDPGLNAPFDPVASRLAQELGMTVIILNGKNLDNLKRCLEGKSFKGTTIER